MARPENVYRYEDCLHFEDEVRLRLLVLPVVGETPQGLWVMYKGRRRWMGSNTTRKFACPTKVEALKSFLARKDKQLAILEYQMSRATRARNIAEVERVGLHLQV